MYRTEESTTETVLYRAEPIKAPAQPVSLPYLSTEPIPGAMEAQTREGARVWVYVSHAPAEVTPAAPPAAEASVPRWAKTTALLSLSLSASSVGAAYALGLFAAAVGALAAALAAAFALIAKVAFVLAVLCGVIVLMRKTGGSAEATATATARGPFGKATATAIAKK